MNKIYSEFFSESTPSSGQVRWVAWTGSVIIWAVIALMGVQTWTDRFATEHRAYNHLVDSARLAERGVLSTFATNRSLSVAVMDWVLREKDRFADCGTACDDGLRKIQKTYAELLPGIELLILSPDGRTVAETDRDMGNRFPGLNALVQTFAGDRDALLAVRFVRNTRNEPALLIPRAIRDRAGEVLAVVVLVEPLAVLDPLFDLPQLGEGHSVTLLDAENTLLARKPYPVNVRLGQRIDGIALRPAHVVGSYWMVSPIDGRERLTVKRELPFSLTKGSMTLLVGMDKEEFLADWWHSTQINLVLVATLLLAWVWGLVTLRKGARSQKKLQASIELTRKVLEEMPVPVAVVGQHDGLIAHSNADMVEEFGALAGAGQPISRLFEDNTAWGSFPAEPRLPIFKMVSRKGPIHVEVHRTELGALGSDAGAFWLVVLVDISERFVREQHLREAATTDTLTGLANRRYFDEVATREIARAHQRGTPIAILALDLDRFKRVNDEHGHDAGDVVLKVAAHLFRSALREGDLAARMGGEEFTALLPATTKEAALAVGERVRQAIATTPVMLPSGVPLTITVSIGVALWHPGDSDDLQPVLKMADQALYEAKESGRNRVCFFEQDAPHAQP